MSHHEQRKSHPVSRAKAQGRPAQVDSPWMLKKISLIRSRSSIISRKLPARCRLRLFENIPQRDMMLAREAFAIVVFR